MKLTRFCFFALMFTLLILISACSAALEGGPDIAPNAGESAVPELSFEALVFQDNAAGIRLLYPSDWVIISRQEEGDRGAQAAMLSPGTTLNQLAEGGTRLSLLYHQWDPKGDLDAYVAQRKLAWEASGFQVFDEENLLLADGRKVIIFSVETTENTRVVSAFLVAGEEYLEINADGNIDLALEIIHTITVIE